KPPQHLVFDSKLTTFEGLDRLDEEGIIFITLRRRSAALLKEIADLPPSAWRTVTLNVPHRKYKTPRVYEQRRALASTPSVSSSSRTSGTMSPPFSSPTTIALPQAN